MQCKYKGCLAHTNYSSGYCYRHAQAGYLLKKQRQMEKKNKKFESMSVVASDNEHQDPPLLGTSGRGG